MARKMICLHEKCSKFGIAQPESNFLYSNFDLLPRYPICKSCLEKYLDLTKLSNILEILQQLNYPYFEKTWELIAKEYPDAVLSRYIAELRKNVNTRKMKFSDTEKMPEECTGLVELDVATKQMKDFFGEDFSSKELIAMNKKYDFMKASYDETTSMHVESLKNYCRLKVKEEFAIAANDVDEAKKWGSMSDKAAQAASLNPAQLKKADLIGGISTFGELTQIIEDHADGVIPVMPDFKYRPDDAIDFILWNFISYEAHLDGREPCKYEDIYKFYDKRKQDYIDKTGDPYNIFKHDPTEGNRERIKEFIKLPNDDYSNQEGEMNGE